MASRDPELLHPKLKPLWFDMHEQALAKGIDLILTCTYRSDEEQAELYASGRTRPGHILTNARPGQSRHNSTPAEAFDVAIIRHGKCVWDTNDWAWQAIGQIGVSLGLEWGWMWTGFKEMPHFQLPK